MKNYFQFMDSIVAYHDTVITYHLTEHILVLVNPWIIDTLASFDYYERMKEGEFIYDQREKIVLHKNDTLRIPDSLTAHNIAERLAHTVIDVNIPEFKLRIIEFDSILYTFTVRVGRNEEKFLKTAGRTVSLRTPIGEGRIIRIERDPWFVNPVSGLPYSITQRDDQRYTRVPQISWLEPEIGGKRQGALIHPTTNPSTLGKPYSNGCIGLNESDAWRVYYHAPVGTKVRFRYDLEVINEHGDTLRLPDIYKLQNDK